MNRAPRRIDRQELDKSFLYLLQPYIQIQIDLVYILHDTEIAV